MPIPPREGRQDHCVQALAEGPLQEGGPVRVLARVRHEQDARVLFLLKIQRLPQQGVPFPPH